MQLFKYPHLVQNEILNHTEFSDLFMLSFVSNKMKKLIKSSSQMQRFRSVNTIRYNHRSARTYVCIPFHYFHDNILKIVKRDDSKNDYFQLNVSGKIVDFSRVYKHKKYFPVAFHQPDGFKSLIEAIHNYLLDFFGDSVEFYWEAHNYKKPIPQLENLTALLHLRHGLTESDILDMTRFENFISSSPVLKCIDSDILNVPAPMSPESKFYQAEYIETWQPEPTLPAILRYFQGRQAFLKWWKCDTQNVIEFVNKWKSGEAFHKLEHLKIKNYENEFPQNEILDAIGAQHIDHAKKPPTHILPKVYFDIAFQKEAHTDPITSYTYVVRRTDNRVASVSIDGGIFSFGVWDKTEEEFLRIVE
ncbi:unnamed protein product [Caenorhabditis nigoni]